MEVHMAAVQQCGWPLGLEPVNMRIGLARNLDFSGSVSFNTLVTGSASSSSSTWSDLDTESTGSLFHDSGITLGSLIGISTSILNHPARSLRIRNEDSHNDNKKSHKSRTCFSLCPRTQFISQKAGTAPSLGHFLQVERGASNARRNNRISVTYELHGLPESQPSPESNTLFSNDGCIAPPVAAHGPLVLAGNMKKSSTCWLW